MPQLPLFNNFSPVGATLSELENAAGQNGVTPPLVHTIYRSDHHSDIAFVMVAKNGVRSHHWKFGNMPPVEGLTAADVKFIARYVRELQKENGIN